MNYEFGNFLQEELNKEGAPSLQDFASMVGISYRTLYNVFNGKSQFTLHQTIKASEILKTDLIGKFLKKNGKVPGRFEEDDTIYGTGKIQQVTVCLNVRGSVPAMDKFPELLDVVQKEAKKRGFYLI